MQSGRRDEIQKVVLAWLWFFLLLMSYYVLKPVRDGMGATLANELGWWYLATFVTMLAAMAVYARLADRLASQWLVLTVYEFFAGCMLGFALYMQGWSEPSYLLTGSFFVWVSVFNLMTVALFWSVMTDVFHSGEGKKWFGILASAGSAGALSGSALTFYLTSLGKNGLLLVSCAGIQITIAISFYLIAVRRRVDRENVENKLVHPSAANPDVNEKNSASTASEPDAAGLWSGMARVAGSRYLLALCGYVILGKFAATFIYNNLQLAFKASDISPKIRTEWFAQMNFGTQIGSMIIQGLIVAWLFRWIGVRGVLAIPCATVLALLVALTIDPSLSVLIAAQVVQQIVGYGLMTPGQNVLFTVLSRQDRYVSKGFIDTVVFRFSDVLAAQLCTQLASTVTKLPMLAVSIIPLMFVWFFLGMRLGKEYDTRADASALETR
jgi:AAA family ATP:ADP antiporter